MRRLNSFFTAIALAITASPALAAITFTGPVTNISGTSAGHVQFPTSETATSFRPFTSTQKSLLVENYYIHDLTNQKAIDVRATRNSSSMPAWAYESVTLRNLKIEDINRREDLPGGAGLHIDFIRIAGGGNSQDVKTNILIENVEIDGGDALPILITDGLYGTITLRNVSVKNTTLGGLQVKTDKVGSVDRIIIDNSPGLGVALIGRPGSVGEVLVRNSPNVRVGDSPNSTGRTNAIVSFIDGVSGNSSGGSSFRIAQAVPGGVTVGYLPVASSLEAAAVPEPGALTLLGLAFPLLLRRTRQV